MVSWRTWSDAEITAFLKNQIDVAGEATVEVAPWNHAPTGFIVDRNELFLGRGRPVFEAACKALRQWKMFELDWLRVFPTDCPIETGRVVGIVTRQFGLTMICPARIIEAIASTDSFMRRFGFTYLALPDHIEQGKERFQIVWNRADDSVRFEIQAISRPRHWLLKLGKPYARHMQRRFARESLAALKAGMAANS